MVACFGSRIGALKDLIQRLTVADPKPNKIAISLFVLPCVFIFNTSANKAFLSGRPPPLETAPPINPALTLSSKDPAFPPFAPFFAWLSLNLLGVKCLKVQFAMDLAMAFTSDKGKGVMN